MLKDAHADRTAEEAVAAVQALVGRSQPNRQRVAEAGGIAPLVAMLSGKSSTGRQAMLHAMLYRFYIGIADGMSIARVWAYRFSK